MKTLKKVGFAASLLLASSLASANVYNLDNITGPGDQQNFDTPSISHLSVFADEFKFTLTEAATFDFLATATAGSVNFTNVVLNGVDATTGTLYSVFSFAEWTADTVGNAAILNSGSYNLSLSGDVMGSGIYTVNAITSPVPEPSTIALMLGGLGMIGFMAARRRNQNV
ncbi:hypothetical protein MNBD_GAMMA03-2050 [hydrothermal vent metagenome]|uniref:Ice-binding protein C-terminal domain-containing protein n=1 Tax=hydrothermal vent metagenome TaxID=652676 RepID=A0A3B0WNA6_9ZZZZ